MTHTRWEGFAYMRIGVDLGGTKIEGIVLRGESEIVLRQRVDTPKQDYKATVRAIADLVLGLEAQAAPGQQLTTGIGTPGARSPATGRMKNCNSTWLNDQPLLEDLEARLQRPLRMANDADCLALSEAADGAAKGASSVFGVIVGTGCGGGLVINGKLQHGPNGIAGEWGHNPLPWPSADPVAGEFPGVACWCGRNACIERYLSGTGLEDDYARRSGVRLAGKEVVALAEADDVIAQDSLQAYEDRMARALASIINILDPEVIVLGGGLSNLERLYRNVPRRWLDYVFSDRVDTRLVQAAHGDSSGVRGAAWLWPLSSN